MKSSNQIKMAKTIIDNLQDYIELAKVQKKLKIENVEAQIENVSNFAKNNVEVL